MAHAPFASSVTLLQRPRGRWGRDRPPPAVEPPCRTVLCLEPVAPAQPPLPRQPPPETLMWLELDPLDIPDELEGLAMQGLALRAAADRERGAVAIV